MKIQSITNNFIPNIKFTSETTIGPEFKHNKIESCDYDDDDRFIKLSEDEDFDDEITKNKNDFDDTKGCLGIGLGLAMVAAMGAAVMGLCKCSGSNEKQNAEFIQDAAKIIQSNDTRKDTIIIKDITGDEKPDLILFKQDGSKVVIDMNNQKII